MNKGIESSRKKGEKIERERPIFYIICMSREERVGEPDGTRPGQVGGTFIPSQRGCVGVPEALSPPPQLPCPPWFRCPHPHSAFQLRSTWGSEWGRAFAQPHAPGLHFPPGRELKDPRLARGSGGWGPGQGASPVTFPRGPDTLTRPLRLPQALGGGLVGVQLGSPSSAWRPGVQPSCQVTLTQLPLRPREWVPSCFILQIRMNKGDSLRPCCSDLEFWGWGSILSLTWP